ncbi:MAG TPA: galactose oxidase-like domain-containing protein [Gemmatimonadales bacterium]
MTRIWQFRSWALAALLAISVIRCGGGGTPPTTPTQIAVVSGDGQTGRIDQPLADALVVAVTDESGNAVPGVSVTWAAQGGGSVSATSTETGSSGQASVTRILGPTVGQQTTTATVAGLQGSPVTFTSTAIEGNPTGGIVITTNPPVAALTSEVFDPVVQPVVTVTGQGGTPVAGQEVTVSLASGSGSLEGKTTATTDANGTARFTDLGINGTGDHTLEFTAGTARVTSSPVSVSALPAEATTGKWGPVVPWDIVPLHMNLLPNGKIFAWGKTDVADTMGMPRIWDPSSESPSQAREIHVDDMLFCAGHTLMPDGRLMVNGGHFMDDAGIKVTYFFDQNGNPSKGPDMTYGRWYPTLTVLEDGRVLTMAGRNEAGSVVRTPEIWDGAGWTQLPGAGTLEIPYYPRNFVDPKNGMVFNASERVQSRWFDVDGTGVNGGRGRWINGPSHIYGFNRDYGSAVMYDAGKILVVGGGGHTSWPTPDPKAAEPTATAEIIDLNAASPTWRSTDPMSTPRRHMNATVLPDGQVLATGGTRGGGFVNINEALAVKTAEVWNPRTGRWTTLSANSVMRVYHSVSLLLPNGTVLHGASGDAMAGTIPVPPERSHEIFEPPYLFKGARPSITSAPATVSYGQTFSVQTPNAAQVTDVRWIRLGAVTHAFDMSQRANTLTFRVGNGAVEVDAPGGARLAPPGHYMLFVLNRNGVPSAGKILQIQ